VKEVPLVDRTEEMNVLKEAVYRAAHGEGGLVFVHGEAGIGKTRLLRELGAYAQSRGVQVLHGRCPGLFRMDGVPPYVIWKEVIKDYLENCIPEQLYRVIGYYPAEVAKLVPELNQKLRTVPQSLPISPEQEQTRLFEAVSQFVTNLSQEAPLLVILDDLQWTDPSSLLLLHYLARGVQKTQLLLLGAYRSTDVDAKHPLTPILAELKRERLPRSVSLKRMSQEDISELIKQILEQDDVPSEFCSRVYDKTRGNPFFTEEVIESLKDEDLIYKENDRWNFKEISTIEFPESVKNVVKARISRLDEESQSVLTMASFIGNDFTLKALSALTDIEERKLLELMDRLLKTGLIKEREVRGEGICSFADILVRDVVYEEVSLLKRKMLHGVVGNALERVYAAKIDEHFGELALHFLESGDRDKALDYFLKAGDKAAEIYANPEAASYYKSALELLEEKTGVLQQKVHVLERLGDVESVMGEYEACIKHWNEALLVLTKLDMKQEIATLHRKMGNVLWNWVGDKEKGKEHHDAALEILEAVPESVELARVYNDSGHRLRRMGNFAEALSLEKKALGIAERLDAQDVIAETLQELALEFIELGDFKKAQDYAGRALKIALDNNYLETTLWAYDRVGGFTYGEEYEKRFECFEKGLALAKKIGNAAIQCDFLLRQAHECLHRGEFNKTIALGEEALSLAKKIKGTFFVSWALCDLGEAYTSLGEWDKSEGNINEALNAAREIKEYPSIAGCYFAFGLLYFSKGEYAKARESYEEAFRLQGKFGDKLDQMYTSWFLVPPSIELGDVSRAQDLLDSWHKFSLETKDRGSIIWEKGLRAMLFRAQKKYAESIKLFEEALQESESIKANIFDAYWFASQLLSEYARVYFERDQPGDREKALKLLNRALAMFDKMGAKPDIEKVEARIAFIETGKEVLKPRLPELVSTGYVDLDKLLCGGLPSNCAVVLTSPACNERDLLVKSFLEAGAKKGEVAFYATINPGLAKTLAENLQSNFWLFVCNPQADAIVKDAPNVVKLKGVENLTDISIALTSSIRKLDPSLKGSRRICLDLVSDVLLQHHTVQTRRWVAGLIPELKSARFTALGVMDSRIHPSEELYAIVGLFDGEISIYEKETDKGPGKYLKIQKMGNQKYLEDEVPLKKEQP
jgi:tetratricopeptide (TPR) repeat protein/KaiC/GvpD/RAD55 family RecA-like ATPase